MLSHLGTLEGQGVGRAAFFFLTSGGTGNPWHSWAYSCITVTSVAVTAWLSSLCVPVCSDEMLLPVCVSVNHLFL